VGLGFVNIYFHILKNRLSHMTKSIKSFFGMSEGHNQVVGAPLFHYLGHLGQGDVSEDDTG